MVRRFVLLCKRNMISFTVTLVVKSLEVCWLYSPILHQGLVMENFHWLPIRFQFLKRHFISLSACHLRPARQLFAAAPRFYVLFINTGSYNVRTYAALDVWILCLFGACLVSLRIFQFSIVKNCRIIMLLQIFCSAQMKIVFFFENCIWSY